MTDLKKVQDYFYHSDYEYEFDEYNFYGPDPKEFHEILRRICQIFPELSMDNFIHKDDFLYDNLDYWVAQCINYYLHNDLIIFPSPTSYNKTDFQIPYNYDSPPDN